MNVALLGASADPERYSNKALKLLLKNNHRVFPVHPTLSEVEGVRVFKSVSEIPEPIDTVTLYVSKETSNKLAPDILSKKPKRIIFNPGAENPELFQKARAEGIQALEACTLVLLSTKQF